MGDFYLLFSDFQIIIIYCYWKNDEKHTLGCHNSIQQMGCWMNRLLMYANIKISLRVPRKKRWCRFWVQWWLWVSIEWNQIMNLIGRASATKMQRNQRLAPSALPPSLSLVFSSPLACALFCLESPSSTLTIPHYTTSDLELWRGSTGYAIRRTPASRSDDCQLR
jgi:hypothetical protein